MDVELIRKWLPEWVERALQHLLSRPLDIQSALQSSPYILGTVMVVIVSHRIVSNWAASLRLASARKNAIAVLIKRKQEWKKRVTEQMTADQAEKITSMTFADLQQALSSSQFTASQVLRAFQYQAAVMDNELNFICEPILEAEQVAARLDQLRNDEKSALLLFGIPISVKENYDLKGYNVNMGMASCLGPLCGEDNTVVQVLRDQGAVPFIRTNIPQTMLTFGCDNPIYGQTLNPYDKAREPGGSSGGEGACIASQSSLLGLGGDIGGSIRIPAAWCGVVGLKPTSGRVSKKYWTSRQGGQRIIQSTPGPLARDVDGLAQCMRCLSTVQCHDADVTISRVLFNEEEYNSTRKLTIGYYLEYEPVSTCETAKRAIRETVNMLRCQGHKVVEWNPPTTVDACSRLFPSVIFGDGGSGLIGDLYGDRIAQLLRPMVFMLSLPKALKRLMCILLKPIVPVYFYNILTANCGVNSVTGWWRLQAEVTEYQKLVIDDWKSKGIDAVICPAMPVPALNIGAVAYATMACNYTILYNLLNFPAGVVPVTRVTSDDLEKDKTAFPAHDPWHSTMKKSLSGSEGLPMAVQCATLPYDEELCLRVMREIEQQMKFTNAKK